MTIELRETNPGVLFPDLKWNVRLFSDLIIWRILQTVKTAKNGQNKAKSSIVKYDIIAHLS
jgi:hypothetical protein